MDSTDLEKLGLNRNEAIVYLGLIKKGQASAAELVKTLGIHRNIVYDNIEKLIEKGLVSYINEGNKKKFIAKNPESIIEFLDSKKVNIDKEIKVAKTLIPEIDKLLSIKKIEQEASLFRGVKGIKKILIDILKSNEYWVIGVSNASIEILGETFWKNFNIKRRSKRIKEHLLFNNGFKNVVNIISNSYSNHKVLPKELTQVTEIMFFHNKVAVIVYSKEPIAVLIENPDVFITFKQQFEFLWRLSKV